MKTFEDWNEIINYSEGNSEDDIKLNHKDILIIKHLDRTELKLVHFKLEKIKYWYEVQHKLFKETVYIIYTEHHGVFKYCESDLKIKPEIIKNYRKKK